MKKLLTGILLGAILTAATTTFAYTGRLTRFSTVGVCLDNDLKIIEDVETGIEYIVTKQGGITVRYNDK